MSSPRASATRAHLRLRPAGRDVGVEARAAGRDHLGGNLRTREVGMRREKVLHALFHPGEVLGVGRGLVAAARTAAVVVHGRGTAPEIADIGEPLPHVRRADDLSVERHHVGLSAVGTCDGRDARASTST